jgi:hypothetical protein
MYLLVIGSPRSGTTLLASMIGAHSDVAMLIEDRTFAITKLTSKKVLANKLCIPHQIEIEKRGSKLKNLLRRRFNWFKNYPSSIENIEDYLALEGAKVICIVRHHQDVINSIMKRGKKDITIATSRWVRSIEIMEELHRKYTDRVLVITYEDLVQATEPILLRASDFLGVSFQKDMLEGYKYNILYPGEVAIDKTRAFKSERNNSQKIIPNLSIAVSESYQYLMNVSIR